MRALSLSLVSIVCCAGLTGCRTAAVDRFAGRIDQVLATGEPAYWVNAPGLPPAGNPNAWYRDLQVILDAKPEDAKSVAPLLAEHRAAILQAERDLLLDVQRAMEKNQSGAQKWSLLSLSCGLARKNSDIQFAADLGLTTLYARRPVIAFDALPFNLCIAKLCRECGIQDAQPRSANPRIDWSRLNVRALDAIDALVSANGFERRYTDVFQRVSLRVQDYPSRAAFVTAAVDGIAEKGRQLDRARPALIITLRDKTKLPEAQPAPDVSPD